MLDTYRKVHGCRLAGHMFLLPKGHKVCVYTHTQKHKNFECEFYGPSAYVKAVCLQSFRGLCRLAHVPAGLLLVCFTSMASSPYVHLLVVLLRLKMYCKVLIRSVVMNKQMRNVCNKTGQCRFEKMNSHFISMLQLNLKVENLSI